ncbi:MAG: tetratricopeptide repeat protein [bacterium]|nr:tetratricopeptide repeat protein [bacterium]
MGFLKIKKKWILIGGISLPVIFFLSAYLINQGQKKKAAVQVPRPLSPQEIGERQAALQRKIEMSYRRSVYANRIAFQKSIVARFPDNIEAKKTLAELYRQAGAPEKADEILKSLPQ